MREMERASWEVMSGIESLLLITWMRSCFIGSGHAVNLTEKYRLTAVFFYCIVGINMGRNGSAGKVFQKNFKLFFLFQQI